MNEKFENRMIFRVTGAKYPLYKTETRKDGIYLTTQWEQNYDLRKKGQLLHPFEGKGLLQMKGTQLLQNILSLNINDDSKILEFCDKWGLLGCGIPEKYGIEEKLDDFEEAVINIRKFYEDYRTLAIKEESLKRQLEQTNKKLESISIQEYEKFDLKKKLKNLENDIWRFNNESKFIFASRFWEEMNNKAHFSFSLVPDNINGGFIYQLESSILLGMAYYQLHGIITKRQELKECPACHNLFVPTVADAIFCPPDIPGTQSLCREAYNAQKIRLRKKGYTEEEITERIKSYRKRT